MPTAERFFIDYETFKGEVDEKFEQAYAYSERLDTDLHELEDEAEAAFERVRADVEKAFDRIRKLEGVPAPFAQWVKDQKPKDCDTPTVTICYPDGTKTEIKLLTNLELLDSSSEGARDRWALISALNNSGVR